MNVLQEFFSKFFDQLPPTDATIEVSIDKVAITFKADGAAARSHVIGPVKVRRQGSGVGGQESAAALNAETAPDAEKTAVPTHAKKQKHSLKGQILKWFEANQGAISVSRLAETLRANYKSVAVYCSQLALQGEIVKTAQRGVYRSRGELAPAATPPPDE